MIVYAGREMWNVNNKSAHHSSTGEKENGRLELLIWVLCCAARLAWCHPQGPCKGLHQSKVGISSITPWWWSILYFVTPFPTIVCTEIRCRHCMLGRLEPSPLVSSLHTFDPWKQKYIMKSGHMQKVLLIGNNYLLVLFNRILVMQHRRSTSFAFNVGLEERQTRILVLERPCFTWDSA